MATLDKNFRIKNGLAVEGNVATVNGENILREGSGDSYIIDLIGGQATSANTQNAVVKRDGNGNFAAGQISLNELVIQNAGQIYEDSALIIESNLGYGIAIAGNQDVNISSQNGNINLNPDGNVFINGTSAANQVATQGYVDGRETIIRTDYAAADTALAGQLGTSIQQAAADATTNANSYTDGLISSEVTNRNNAIDSAISQEVTDRDNAITSAINSEVTSRDSAIATAKSEANTYTDGKVSDLVASAPELLDTLNELAAAIADNPNYATDVANLVATKADTTYVDSEISDLDSAAQGYALTAQENAQDYASSISNTAYTNAVADAGTNAENYTNTAIANGDGNAEPIYKGVKLGYYTELISGWANVNNGAAFVPVSWNPNYGTAKLTVHVRDGVHSQASEILVARDSSYNLAITEYAIVTTNGVLADVSVRLQNSEVQLVVTPVNGHTTVEAVATGSVIVWAD